ncbi:MAG: single-stranded-DNA-specific exonuclease RecJ [Oscillospiraceae bacterium]|jgi:single-stranded-DNA-specific exonuclease|nr:single-stranded-DNA-specific exonuclease RecJ [Oscillospiraceae bacterium]
MKPYLDWHIGKLDSTVVETLSKSYSRLMSALLCVRNITDIGQAHEFLRDDTALFSDPNLLADIDKATARIKLAIQNKERVAVFGDYDVDGITSTCVMTSYLISKGVPADAYIPDRLTEGYGLSEEAIITIAESGITLLISVDCGVTGAKETKIAKELGLDVVITDHHECPDTLPDASAVVDPCRADCAYPFKGLAGVGVAFAVLRALEGTDKTEELIEEYGDLVAIGTIADIMPVIGENRAIIRRGVQSLRRGTRCGLRCLMSDCGIVHNKITGADLSFMLVPKLNAAGRMGKVRVAYDMIMCSDEKSASELSKTLCALNNDRRSVENKIFTEIRDSLLGGDVTAKVSEPIVAYSEIWHNGVSGIVASRLADTFGVPAVVICIENGVGRGSCRSFGNFSIFDALDSMKEELTTFGGHFHAAGLTIPQENIVSFSRRLKEYYKSKRKGSGKAQLMIDFKVSDNSMLSLDNVESLEDLAPWGPGNPPPILAITGAEILTIISIGGDRHLKLKIRKNGQIFESVCFGVSTKEFEFNEHDIIDIAFEPIVNEFRGSRSVQLIMRDVHRSAPAKPRTKRGSDNADLQHLCKRFFNGAEFSKAERSLLRPDRRDLVAVWKTICGKRLANPLAIADQMETLAKAAELSNSAKAYICVKAFEELGLAKISRDGLSVTITPKHRNGNSKVNLADSDILRRLSN